MNEILKRGKLMVIFLWIILIVIIILGGVIGYYYYIWQNQKMPQLEVRGGTLINPAQDLTFEEAIAAFNESFVYYFLINIGAYRLHSPPLSSETPKINFYIEGESYSAEIVERAIYVFKGLIEDSDIIIRTSAEEAVKMMNNKEYIKESFKKGSSNIELVASKIELAAKGYLKLYEELGGGV